MALIPVNLVFEDQISEYVMIRLVDNTNKFQIIKSFSEGGFGYIKRNIYGFNEASKGYPFFVLVDLDNIFCAPELIKGWLKVPAQHNLIFRIAVREVEAWLLADIEGFSSFTGISKVHFTYNPEELSDPKRELLRLIKICRKRSIREDILPKDEFAAYGPNYNGRMAEFVINYWSIERASLRSDSLRRTIHHLANFSLNSQI